MKTLKLLAIAAVFAAQTPAFAQDAAPAVAKRSTIFSADGEKIGRVETVGNGAVRLIYRGKFLSIPTSSLTADANGFKTSLTSADLKKM